MKSAVANKVLPFEVPELSVLERPISLEEGIRRSQANLLGLQQSDGHWEGELIADATLCCDYIIYMHWLGKVDEAHVTARQWAERLEGPHELSLDVGCGPETRDQRGFEFEREIRHGFRGYAGAPRARPVVPLTSAPPFGGGVGPGRAAPWR